MADSKASKFDPATFRDRYEEALLAHLKTKCRVARLAPSLQLAQAS
jgi:non-homologous end joining protein Ku